MTKIFASIPLLISFQPPILSLEVLLPLNCLPETTRDFRDPCRLSWERQVSSHRRRKRGRRSFERAEARKWRMRSKRRVNRQCFRNFAKHLLPRKLDLVAVQPSHLATQETQGQRINKQSVKPHVAFRNGRRKLKLLLRQRQIVSPQVKKKSRSSWNKFPTNSRMAEP